jgi:hypothetical protein
MGVGQVMIFVGHEFRLKHLRYLPNGYSTISPCPMVLAGVESVIARI